MTDDWRKKAFRSALKMVEGGEPRDLVKRAQADIDDDRMLTSQDLTAVVAGSESPDYFLTSLGMQVAHWDAAPDTEEWAEGTQRSTVERRALVTGKLGLDEQGAAELLAKRPIFHDETIVITAPWERWYADEQVRERAYYWPRYRDYLLNTREWPEENVTALDLATSDIVERLANPTRTEAYQSKGLVVGYVQSGKTANFTGVVAKAIDAGYRVIIVMTGTIEMLRAQTQRRIDMEMVGRQNLLGDLPPDEATTAVDYQDDDDWSSGKFLDLGPGHPTPEILRLTKHHAEYRAQFKGLKIERFDPTLPLYHPKNLYAASARLVICKKNATVLKKLVNDIKANKNAFAEIPVLIVDDESDEASINTVDPKKVAKAVAEGKEIARRRAINQCIADMLSLMPRAQYVGYTATPFANVFVDPADPEGIFPKDFVVGLRRPPGYMGVEDFHDLDRTDEDDATLATSNEKAFVRSLEAADDDEERQDDELGTAIDMFVLTGAVKLHRSSVRPDLSFKHHTMLVHNSVRTAKMAELATTIKRLWAGYTTPASRDRLKDLYASDIVPVSDARPGAQIPPLPPFEELVPFIAQAISRITEASGNPVLVVNSDKDIQADQQRLDFDRNSTWRILVGGAKLSRGFTIEGLTVSYFRRATNIAASLTQMGRWFGFRPGYRDLVRLYIARHARFGSKTFDLYEAFEGVALDERAFREQLDLYSEWDGDKPRLVPAQIPPLVTQHLPWLRPVANNKMFNAVITEQRDQAFTPTGYANRPDQLKENLDVWRSALKGAGRRVTMPSVDATVGYDAFVGTVTAEDFVEMAENTHYIFDYFDSTVKPRTNFYRRLIDHGLLDDFLLVLPQPAGPLCPITDVRSLATVSRRRRARRGGLFGEITDPKHRPAIEGFVKAGAPPLLGLEDLAGSNRGALLTYLVKESDPEYENDTDSPPKSDDERGVVIAFSAYVPGLALTKSRSLIRFTVRVPEQENDATVDVS